MKAEVRLYADDGLWCSFLLPVAFLINYLNNCVYNIHETNFILCILSFGTLIIIFENKFHLFINQVPQIPVLKHSHLLLIAFSTIILLQGTVFSWCFLLLITFLTACLFDYIYNLLLVKCPRSFTFGEAAIIAQGITLFIISCSCSWYNELHGAKDDFKEISLESKFLQILIIGCIILIWIQHMNKCLQSIYPFYTTCIVLGLIMYGLWTIALHQDPILWLLSVCFKNKNRIILMCFWIILTIASALFVVHQNLNKKQQASTKSRKYFHIIVIFVFLPGILLDPELLHLASAGVLCIFVVLEMLRILEIQPLGLLIQNSFQLFLDEKDAGFLILTHIYLLIGCSCPLWLHTGKFDDTSFHISLLSGIISVGIGDTIAAIAGSHFGKHKWPGSEKTIEGTLFAILAQVVFATPILFFNGLRVWWDLFILLIAVVFTSILEANTSQVDNLVLPLFMYPLLCVIQ